MEILSFVTGLVGPLLTTIILGFTIILLYLWYTNSRNLDYWKKRGVPSVTGAWADAKKPFHDIELERYNKYGRIYGHFEGSDALLSVADVELVRNILVKDFQAFTERRDVRTGDNIIDNMVSLLQGEDWKRVRNTITPTFTTGKIKRMTGIFKECAKTLVSNFKKVAEDGKAVEVKSLYGAFIMDVIASSAFSTKIDSLNDPNNEFVASAKSIFNKEFNWRGILFVLFPGVMKLFKIPIFASKPMKFFKDATIQIIEERKKSGQTRNDFLQLLLDTTKELTDEDKLDFKPSENDVLQNYGKDESDVLPKSVAAKKPLSLDELIAQCVSFFIAGYDTAASTLSFASYLLAINPEVQEKLIQELDDALKENNGELTYDALQDMKFLDNVISETLRMFPPVVRLERVAGKYYTLGDTGIKIPKGMIVSIPVYAMHRDPEYFPEPEKFNPDRFNPEERAKRSPYVYLPFGAGPRNCIAMRFALVEMKVCLAYVLSNFRFKKCAETKVPIDFYCGQGLLLPKSILLQLEERTDRVKAL